LAEIQLNAKVISKVELSARVMTLRVAADGWELPDFVPGQFAVLGLPGSAPRSPWSEPEPIPGDPDKLLRRSYSITTLLLKLPHHPHLHIRVDLPGDGGWRYTPNPAERCRT
jgi:ferredoxin--NADP+ reductase